MDLTITSRNARSKFRYTNGRKSFPVVEFLSSPDESLNIPSFILETLWPRVLYFYYPNQPDFEFFHENYVQIARRIRHESDVLVLFYAISCAAHTEMCINSDLIQQFGRPLLKAYENGSIEGTEILIENRFGSDVNGSNDEIIQRLGKALSLDNLILHGAGLSQPDQHHQGITVSIAAQTRLQETHNDAIKAFFLTLKHNVFGDLDQVTTGASKRLSRHQADALKDFFDLCYWTLPSSFKIHQILLDLRTDFDTIIGGPDKLKSILLAHGGLNPAQFSKQCSVISKKQELESNDINSSSYSCGLWNLLHIISIGVNECSGHVMGDSNRATSAYAAWVIRDFISLMIPDGRNNEDIRFHKLQWCKGCRDSIMKSFDSCQHEQICIDHLLNMSNLQRSNGDSTSVAQWLWEVHAMNAINSVDIEKAKIPYGQLKQKYWPDEKVVRIAVLKRFRRDLPNIKQKVVKSGITVSVTLVIILAVVAVFLFRHFRGKHNKRKKRY